MTVIEGAESIEPGIFMGSSINARMTENTGTTSVMLIVILTMAMSF